jgi:hypothetical protein
MKRVRVSHLRAIAAQKKRGYLAECRQQGKPSPDGKWLEFTEEAHARIAVAYATPAAPACPWPQTRTPSLGQAVDHRPPPGCVPCAAKFLSSKTVVVTRQVDIVDSLVKLGK